MENNRSNFWIWNKYFWKVTILHIIQVRWKKQLSYELFSFNLPVKYVHLYNFCLWKCLWNLNAYRLVVWKVFLFKLLRKIPYLHWQTKSYFDKKCQNHVLSGKWQYEYGCLSLIYWNLNSSTKIFVLQWLLGFILVCCSQKVKWYTFTNRFL